MLKIEKLWTPRAKALAKAFNTDMEQKNPEGAYLQVQKIIEILKDPREDPKDRVSVCFILERLPNLAPFAEDLLKIIIQILQQEKDPHLLEFSLWFLGNLVERVLAPSEFGLIKDQLQAIPETQWKINPRCQDLIKDLLQKMDEKRKRLANLEGTFKEKAEFLQDTIKSKTGEMFQQAESLSKDALALDYAAAAYRREEMEIRIRKFKEENDKREADIKKTIADIIQSLPEFQGREEELFSQWQSERGIREGLIRKVHCILRIQSKIFLIIKYIEEAGSDNISLSDIKAKTDYSEADIKEILGQLVKEEIIPHLVLDRVAHEADGEKKGTKQGKKSLKVSGKQYIAE
jgi:hypothetical protein